MLLFTFVLIKAAYFEKLPYTIKQPDGKTINCFVSGDEFYNWIHDAKGFTIIQAPDGYYYYAEQNGELVQPSIYLVNSVDPASVGLSKGIRISKSQYEQKRSKMLNQEASKGAPNSAPQTGNLYNLVVYMRFSDDTEFTTPRQVFDDKFNQSTGVSLKSYFKEVSYNNLIISSFHSPDCALTTNLSYQDSHPRGYFQPYNETTNPIGYTGDSNGAERYAREDQLLVDALNWINLNYPVPISTNLDGDGDGNIDNVCFIVRGSSTGWADLLWGHCYSLLSKNVKINGKTVSGCTFQPENQSDVRTLSHEMFHMLSAPDLYHYTNMGVICPAWLWDPMEQGSGHMLMYMKWKYSDNKWISTIPEITISGTYTLNPVTSPLNNCYKIPSPNSIFEYFVVEYRNKSGTFETFVPGSGLIVYRIDTRQTGNYYELDEVYVYRPDGTKLANGFPDNAYFSSEISRTDINDATNPNSFLQDGSIGGLNISEVTAAGSTISFKVTLSTEPGPALSVEPSGLTLNSTSGATGSLNVTSNKNWTVTDDADWLNLSSASGTGNRTITVTTASDNTSVLSRSARVTFSASGVNSVVVTVTQNGTGNLLAHYPLISDAGDVTGNYPDMTLINTPFSHGGIYCNGIYEGQGYCNAYTPTLDQISYDKLTFTIEFMIEKYMSAFQNPVLVAGAGAGDRWLGFAILPNGQYSLNADNFTEMAVSSATCTLNVWHSAAITYESSTNNGKLYIDGELVCEGIFTFNKQYAHKSIGIINYSSGKVFTGYIRNIKIYNDIISGINTNNDEIKNPGISIFPNPVSGILTIEYEDDNFKTVNIINSKGVAVAKEIAITPKQQLDFSKFKPGLYILEFIKTSGEIRRVKVLNH